MRHFREETLTLSRLKSALHYDPDTGCFTRIGAVWNHRQFIGKPAGNRHSHGYRIIRIDGKQYAAARLAVFYMTGKFPTAFVDHINRDRMDDRWCNLRQADESQNAHNRKRLSSNSSGYKGVHYVKHIGKYQARISCRGNRLNLGYYETAEAAHSAYREAAATLHKEYANAS